MTSRRRRSGDQMLWAARIEAEAITDAKAEGQPSPSRSSSMAVALVDQARTKLPSVSEVGVGGELVPCDMSDERSVTLRNTVANPDHVAADASRDRLELLHATGALELGLDAADTVQANNSLERMLAHQLAAMHRSFLKMTTQLNRLLNVIDNLSPTHSATAAANVEACRLANAIGRLTTSYQSGIVTLEGMRSGGKQHVVVQYVYQHVQVGEGGQAMVAGQVKAGVSAKREGGGAAKMNDEPHATTWSERLIRAEAAPRCLARRRDGAECKAPAMPNGRCRMHGGLSTGPRTAAGLERSRQARWRHGHYSAQTKAERREARAPIRLLRELLDMV